MGENRLMSDLWEINQHLNEQVEELQQANSKLTAEKESLEKRFEELQIAKAVDDAMIAQYDDDLKTRLGMRAVAEIERLREENTKLKELLRKAVEVINREISSFTTCEECNMYDEETTECNGNAMDKCSEIGKWLYTDEALNLIGGAE